MKYLTNSLIPAISLFLYGCDQLSSNKIHFSTAAIYPPFEYMQDGEIKGFDIDLARLIAKKLHKEAVFDDMQFSTVLPSVSSGQDDAAISTITITKKREQNFSFTEPYFFQSMALVYKANNPINGLDQLSNKKVAVQLGSVMEIWLKEKAPTTQLLVMNNPSQTIEALKVDHVDAVLMDGVQAKLYSKKNPQLAYTTMGNATEGFGIALPKNSPLTQQINQVLLKLKANGEIKKLESKWLEDTSWNH